MIRTKTILLGLNELNFDYIKLYMNQEKLTKTERVKVFVTLSNYIFPKTKFLRDKFTLEKLKEKKEDLFNPDPTKHFLK